MRVWGVGAGTGNWKSLVFGDRGRSAILERVWSLFVIPWILGLGVRFWGGGVRFEIGGWGTGFRVWGRLFAGVWYLLPIPWVGVWW